MVLLPQVSAWASNSSLPQSLGGRSTPKLQQTTPSCGDQLSSTVSRSPSLTYCLL